MMNNEIISLLFLSIIETALPFYELRNEIDGERVDRRIKEQRTWSYSGMSGPQYWSNRYVACRGNLQSPVNIASDSLEEDENLEPFTFVGYETPIQQLILENNGHTVLLRPQSQKLPGIKDGGLDSFYSLSQINFHWGSDDLKGSEHAIEGRSFPMEIHLIHQNYRQTTEGEAGTAILAVLLEVTMENNIYLQPIVDALDRVTFKDTQIELMSAIQLYSFLPLELAHYYRYIGSLTVPPCTEGIVWTVFSDPIPIGIQQLTKFRTMRQTPQDNTGKSEFLLNNFRPLQKLNGRKILEALPECHN